MALHFHSLKIQKLIKETKDCIVVTFEIPNHLKEVFQFIQGQNVTLKTTINGEEIRRSYSICTAPFEDKLSVAIKKVEQGVFSTFANEHFKIGDTIEVMPPTGKFYTTIDATQPKNYVAFACGSGITPILSILKTTLKNEPESNFTLVYSNKSFSSILFFEAIESLKNKYMQRFTFINLLSREKTEIPLYNGRINFEKLEHLSSLIDYKNTDDFFICGPEEMIFTTKDFLETKGIAKEKIHFELFAASTPKKNIISSAIEIDSKPKSNITIQLDGRSFDFKLNYDGESILDAALQKGADLPYACKGGVCCTCKAKLIAGEVKMDINYALEPEEVTQGYILTCQSHPITDSVIIDFDIK